METKANYVLVGAFTVLVFVAAFAFVWWIARVDTGGQTARLNITIEGSVTGLSNSSTVKYNGIDVGRIDQLGFDPNDPNKVIAQTRVRRDLPITDKTTAVVSFTGLTGIGHIELEGGSYEPSANLFTIAAANDTVAVISAKPTPLNDLLATAQDIANRADNILKEFEGFAQEARGPLADAVDNISKITDVLADNSDRIDEFLTGMGDVGTAFQSVSSSLERTLDRADKLLAAVSPEDVQAIIADARAFTGNASQASDGFEGLVESAQTTLSGLEQTGARINQSVQRVDELLEAVDDQTISQAITSFAEAGENARKITQDVAGVTQSLEGRNADIDTIFNNVTQMSDRLNAASARVDSVLTRIESFVGTGDGQGQTLMAEASQTLASFREVADNLNSRLDTIGGGLERFSDRGLREVEALVNETRQSITRIEQAITSIERDPQRLLFGGDGTVRRFDGSRQRR